MQDLHEATRAARYLASSLSAIRALEADGASEAAITTLRRELHAEFPGARAAIRRVAGEFRRTRPAAIRLGDVTAASAHEAAVELVYLANRERAGVDVVGQPAVETWPDAAELRAEIEREHTAAVAAREEREAAAGADTFVLVSKVWPERFDNLQKCKRYLGSHPEIRTRKPSSQRLEVHAGDWVTHWDEQGQEPSDADLENYLAGIEERKREVKARK